VSSVSLIKTEALPDILKQGSFKNRQTALNAPVRTSIKGKKLIKDPALIEEEKSRKEEADGIDSKEEDKEKELAKKMEKKNFMGRLMPYNKPCINVLIGLVCACIQGCVFPTFGTFLTKILFTYMNPDKVELRKGAD
jgi:hypothetical protein